MSPTNGRARGCSRCSLPTTSYAGWWRSLGKGRYTPARVFQLVIDLLVLLAMLGLMVSGVMLSNHVFAFLPISGGMSFARLLHMASAYWGFVLMSLHLGLHWNMILSMARRAAGANPRAGHGALPATCWALLSRSMALWPLSAAACPPICLCRPTLSFLITANRSRCFTSTIWP